MILKTRMLGQTYEFKDVKDVLAKASEKKFGRRAGRMWERRAP